MSDATLIIRNGTVIDGSGGAPFEADVAIANGKITQVGKVPGKGDREIDAKGQIFVDMGSATNACQGDDGDRKPDVMGLNPCTELLTRGGTWKYDANKLNQAFSAKERYATGWSPDGAWILSVPATGTATEVKLSTADCSLDVGDACVRAHLALRK